VIRKIIITTATHIKTICNGDNVQLPIEMDFVDGCLWGLDTTTGRLGFCINSGSGELGILPVVNI